MNWVERLEQLDMAQHPIALDESAIIETWLWAGIKCEIGRGSYGANGYVWLPRRVARRLNGLHFSRFPFEVHGGVSVAGLNNRWCGFDTWHAGDYWGFSDGIEYAYDKDVAECIGRVEYKYPPSVSIRVPWTLDRVRVETRQLAEQVAMLNYVVPWRPEHRAMRRRLQLARTRGDE